MKYILFSSLIVISLVCGSDSFAEESTAQAQSATEQMTMLDARHDFQCTTFSVGRYFNGFGYSSQSASAEAIRNCTYGGGYPNECRNNLRCSFGPPNPPPPPPPNHGSYFDWGRGQNGWGYCYEFAYGGYVLNGGQAVANYLCEQTRPSYYAWGPSQSGFTYCYQFTPYGVAMNQGQPVPEYLCH